MTALCRVVHRHLVVRISPEVLQTAFAYHPDFWDGESDGVGPALVIPHPGKFMIEVCDALNEADEDGSTRLTRFLDGVLRYVVESGCEGLDFKVPRAIRERRVNPPPRQL
jgi:hypothetical protein